MNETSNFARLRYYVRCIFLHPRPRFRVFSDRSRLYFSCHFRGKLMRPDYVTDGMVDAAMCAMVDAAEVPSDLDMHSGIAAALTAMPDDLLRKLCAERGCVLVPRNTLKILTDMACAKGAMEHAEIMALGDVEDLLSAPQLGKEKGDE